MMADVSSCVVLDKFSLNKKIVSMRSVVQQAKTHIFNKLTREAKKLQVLKNGLPELQAEKRTVKASRLVEELQEIKKLSNDDVSKFALVSKKEALDAVRADPTSSLDKKAMARIASHPLLMKSVDQFRSKFPQWEASLSSLIDNLGVKVKRNKYKTSLALEEPKAAIKKQGIPEIRAPKTTKQMKPVVMVDDSVPEKNKQNTICKLKTLHGNWMVEEVKEEICDTEEHTDKTKTAKHKEPAICTKKKKKPSVKPLVATKRNAIKVARFSEVDMSTSLKTVDEISVKPAAKTVDSFFVAEDGQTEFLSTVTLKEQVMESEPTISHKYDKMRETYFNKFGRVPNRKELRSQEKQKEVSKFKTFHNTFTKEKDEDWSNKSKSKAPHVSQPDRRKPASTRNNPPTEEGPVHPSWEAKRKQKEMLSISAFQGKKIKFDDT